MVNEHYEKYKDTIKKVARRNYRKRIVLLNEYLADNLRRSLTWDTMYSMIDQSILEFFENHEHPEVWDPHYGERTIETVEVTMEKEKKAREKEFKKNFDMVKLESSSWTIEVPVRKKK